MMLISLPIILSSNGLASEYIFGREVYGFDYDTIMNPDDSLYIVYDSLGMPVDTLMNDTISADSTDPSDGALFKDLVVYNADDSVRFSIIEKKVYLFGNGYVKYLTTELRADYIELDMENKLAYATGVLDTAGNLVGTPEFKDVGNEFESKELRYNFDTKKGLVKDIITQEGEGYIQGKLTKKINDSVYCVKDGWYTTCDEHDHPHFYLRMSKAKMIKDDKVVTGFTHLVLEDVPLPLFIPFGFFPITKKGTSGVIVPTYGEERIRGFNLRNGGYYFYINDYVDATLTGDIYTNGSWALGASSVYRVRYRFNGRFNFNISKNYQGEKGLPDYQTSDSWSLQWTHTQDAKANPYTSFSASVDISSANNNYYNSSNINDIANQRKQSSISWSKKWPTGPFSLSGSFNHSQNSRDSTISLTLPSLSLRMSQIYPFRSKTKVGNLKWYDNIGVSYNAELRNSISNAKESELMKTSFMEDWTNYYKHTIPISLSFKISRDITLTPNITYNGYLNTKTMEQIFVPDTSANGGTLVHRVVPGLNYSHDYSTSASISYGPKIYGMFEFKPEARVAAIRHVISPTLSASYTPPIGPLGKYTKSYFDGEKEVTYSIYSGSGIVGPTSTKTEQSGSISFSLDNNVEMKLRNGKDTTSDDGMTKVKLLESFRLSASYNPFADSMNFSTISLSARTKVLNNRVDLNLSGTLDPYALDETGRRINKYHGGIGRLTSLNMSTGINFSSDNGKNREEKNEIVGGYYDDYLDFDVPWSINIDYTFGYSKSGRSASTTSQMIRANGNVSLTPKWKIGYSTGYDISNKEITATSFNIARDLHCWEMTLTCIPFGTHQSYNFEIRVKSSLLRDLKLTKKDSWYDKFY